MNLRSIGQFVSNRNIDVDRILKVKQYNPCDYSFKHTFESIINGSYSYLNSPTANHIVLKRTHLKLKYE